MRYKYKAKVGEFRLLRVLSIERNLLRLRKHVARLTRRMRNDPAMKRMRLQNARRRRVNP